ncbi:MAG TPA: hypothetical protein VFO55_07720 [Gemmatimonadaceae bacterium]|nr:hypothetical protein [Gemmatimonadaceae bacterium]
MLRRYLPLAAGLLASTPLPAQQRPAARPTSAPMMASVDTTLFRGLQYRMVGPNRGGRVTTVTGVPSQPRTFYMGVASGGVFKTTDGGARWYPVTDGKMPLGSTGSIAVAESDPNVVYVGTGSDGLRSNVSTGRGVYKSTDAGQTWSFAGLYNNGNTGALRIHPRDPNTVWVASIGDVFKPNPDRGIYKTTDGGKSWRRVLRVSDSTGAADVELHPADPNIVYAWMARAERKPWTIISGAREGGFYKSSDGGETWKKVTAGLPSGLIGKGNIAVTAANPNRVYALIEALPNPGFYRSEDAGETWSLINPASNMLTRPFYYTTLSADPTNANTVYGGSEGFFKSVDGGVTWQSLPTPHGDNHDLWINPNDGNTMVQSNDGGANVSTDGGRTWTTQNNQPTAEIYQVWLDNQFPYRLYGAQQDNSTLIVPSQSLGAGQPEYRADGPGCETGPIIPHPTNPDTVYGSCKGQYEWKNMKTGTTKQYWVGGQSLYGNDAKDLIWRFQRVSPMALSPHDPKVLYYGSQYVHRTRDAGVTWETISPDLTAKPACCQGASGEPITRDVTGEEFYSTLYAISESPLEAGVIWTGSNDGPFHITRDNGRTWTNITPKDLPTGGRVAFIDVSTHRRGTAYYAVYRYLLGDYAPYIYRTTDYGRTWTRLTDGKNGIPADWPTRVVREDPDRAGLLYAGTEFGMFISFDDGAHWQSFQLNMPNVPINDIKVHQKDLVVATQGRSFWILDDLSPLHQITPSTSQQSSVLFRPRDAHRVRPAGGRGGGGRGAGGGRGNAAGPDPAAPQYSPPGGVIEYYLASVPASGVRIDIADSTGRPVAAFSSEGPVALPSAGAAPATPTNSDDPAAAAAMAVGQGGGRGRGGAGAPAARPSKTVGMNRFYWDFVNQANTMPVPPGTYRVTMTAGSYTATHPWRVLIDPRLTEDGITAADLREQYLHNLRMRDMSAEVQRLQGRLQTAQTRLTAAGGGAAADSLQRVRSILSRVLDQPVRYGKPGVATHIRYLASMTAGADQKVGRDAIARYQVLRRELDALIAETDRAIGR